MTYAVRSYSPSINSKRKPTATYTRMSVTQGLPTDARHDPETFQLLHINVCTITYFLRCKQIQQKVNEERKAYT